MNSITLNNICSKAFEEALSEVQHLHAEQSIIALDKGPLYFNHAIELYNRIIRSTDYATNSALQQWGRKIEPIHHNRSQWLFQLPRPLIQDILRYLQGNDLKALLLSCKSWLDFVPQRVAEDQILMPKLFVQYLIAYRITTISSLSYITQHLVQCVVECGSQVTGLDLSNFYITDTDIQNITIFFKNLQVLNVSDNVDITTNGIAQIGELTRLKALDLHNCDFAAKDSVHSFSNLNKLEVLNLGACTEVGDWLQIPTTLNALRVLNVAQCGLPPSSAAVITSLSSLEEVNVSQNNLLAPEMLVAIAQLPRLRILKMKYCRVTDAVLFEIVQRTTLVALVLRGASDITNKGIAAVATHPLLQRISLVHCHLKDADCLELAKMRLVHTLDISENEDITIRGIAELTRLTSLQTLVLKDSFITDQMCEKIGQITSLQKLVINAGQLTRDGFRSLSTIPSLRSLRAENQSDTDLNCIEIAKCTTLEQLILSGSEELSENGLGHLASLTRLRSLYLNCCAVNDAMCTILATFSSLEKLSLEGSNGESNAPLVSAQGVHQLNQLRSLSLRSCDIDDTVLNAISAFSFLQELDISENQRITDQGFCLLAQNRSLKKVLLVNVPITDRAIEVFINGNSACKVLA